MSDDKTIFLELEKGQVLFTEGDEGKDMYIILSGSVQVFLLREGLQIILANMGAGRFLGEMSLLEQEPRSAGVIALEPARLLVINSGNFQNFICQNPALAIKLMKNLSSRLRAGNEQISTLEQKVYHLSAKGPQFLEDGKVGAGLGGIGQLFRENLKKASREEISCPVCFHTFPVYLLQMDMQLKSRNYWLREYHDGLEPLWFKQVGCPKCSFAAPYKRFQEVGQMDRQYLKDNEQIRKSAIDLSTLEEYSHEYVLALYRLVLLSLEEKEENLETLARTALELSWLYGDIQKPGEEEETLKKALACYGEIMSRKGLQRPGLMQESLYYQGLIYLRFKDKEKAEKFFRLALGVDEKQDSLITLFAREILEAILLERPIMV